MMIRVNEGHPVHRIPCTGESGHPVHQRAKIRCTGEAVTRGQIQFLTLDMSPAGIEQGPGLPVVPVVKMSRLIPRTRSAMGHPSANAHQLRQLTLPLVISLHRISRSIF